MCGCERGSERETENNIIPHCLQRTGTSLQDILASSSLWLVGDVWVLKLPTCSLKTGVAKQSSIPPLQLQPRANYARLHADETCSCQALHACYKSPFRRLCLSDWTGYGGSRRKLSYLSASDPARSTPFLCLPAGLICTLRRSQFSTSLSQALDLPHGLKLNCRSRLWHQAMLPHTPSSVITLRAQIMP